MITGLVEYVSMTVVYLLDNMYNFIHWNSSIVLLSHKMAVFQNNYSD
jgi:hypothetical protein